MAEIRYTTTDPYMAAPTGLLVRLIRFTAEPAEAYVLDSDNDGAWERTPVLDHLATDDSRSVLSTSEATRVAALLGHPDPAAAVQEPAVRPFDPSRDEHRCAVIACPYAATVLIDTDDGAGDFVCDAHWTTEPPEKTRS